MSLRIFRRGSSKPAVEQGSRDVQPPVRGASSASPASARRGGAGSARRTGLLVSPTPRSPAPPAAKPTPGRTRRGRRGGRKTKAAATTPAVESPVEAAPAAPVRVDGRTLEALLAQQEAVLKVLQGSLSAIENRIVGLNRVITERPRVGIFVDVPNVIYAAERLRLKIDFGKLLDFLVRGRELVRASAYAPISDDLQAKLDTQKFVQPFIDYGYRIVTKPLKRYADGSMKANFDVELAMDVLTMSDRLDIVTLVSGDGDFRRMVELVASKGVRVEVVAFRESTAAELRAVADEYINLNDHLAELRVK